VSWDETVWRDSRRSLRLTGRKTRQKYHPLRFVGIANGDYSLLLQRKITDFGAEKSFGHAVAALKEHYRIEVPQSAVRKYTLKHAEMSVNFPVPDLAPDHPLQCVTSMDGTMLPVMGLRDDPAVPDGRKRRFTAWKEAKHCMAYTVGSSVSRHRVSFSDPDKAGLNWRAVAEAAGITPETYVHGIGDGAPWIADQFRTHFGGYGEYTLDLFHVCERFAKVTEAHPKLPKDWLHRRKAELLDNQWPAVLNRLRRLAEPAAVPDKDAPARTTLAYLEARTGYLDYKTALARGLPVGSGCMEGSHRSVLQERLKISGAWWSDTSVHTMSHLRVLRANQGWESYWEKQFSLTPV
jgi:hypothetical protein